MTSQAVELHEKIEAIQSGCVNNHEDTVASERVALSEYPIATQRSPAQQADHARETAGHLSELAIIAAALRIGTEGVEANVSAEAWGSIVEFLARDYQGGAEDTEIADPLLAAIADARAQRDQADKSMRRLIAYARTCPRPYSLRTIGRHAKMAPNTVSDYADEEAIATARQIVLEATNQWEGSLRR